MCGGDTFLQAGPSSQILGLCSPVQLLTCLPLLPFVPSGESDALPAPAGKPVLCQSVCCLSSGVFLSQPSGLHALSLGTRQQRGKHRAAGAVGACLACADRACERLEAGGSEAARQRTAGLPEVLLSLQLGAGIFVVSGPFPGAKAQRICIVGQISPGGRCRSCARGNSSSWGWEEVSCPKTPQSKLDPITEMSPLIVLEAGGWRLEMEV